MTETNWRIVRIGLLTLLLAPPCVLGLGYVIAMWPLWTFPNRAEVTTILATFDSEPDAAQRTQLLDGLFYRLQVSDSEEMDSVVGSTFEQLTTRFERTGDEAILRALEHVDSLGFFAEAACREYAQLANLPQYWQRYDANPGAKPTADRALHMAMSLNPEMFAPIQDELQKHNIGPANGGDIEQGP